MDVEVRLPQLDEVLVKIEAINKKLDALALAAVTPSPTQLDLPLTDKPPADKPKATTKTKRGAVRIVGVSHTHTQTAETAQSSNGEAPEDHNDEDTQRARAAFEAKRVARTLGIGALRATIKKVAGDGILQVDDVPAWQLLQLLSELQAV
jgi:hypothetical protein